MLTAFPAVGHLGEAAGTQHNGRGVSFWGKAQEIGLMEREANKHKFVSI